MIYFNSVEEQAEYMTKERRALYDKAYTEKYGDFDCHLLINDNELSEISSVVRFVININDLKNNKD